MLTLSYLFPMNELVSILLCTNFTYNYCFVGKLLLNKYIETTYDTVTAYKQHFGVWGMLTPEPIPGWFICKLCTSRIDSIALSTLQIINLVNYTLLALLFQVYVPVNNMNINIHFHLLVWSRSWICNVFLLVLGIAWRKVWTTAIWPSLKFI